MNHDLHAQRGARRLDIDTLLWDSYLLVAELRSGLQLETPGLQARCIETVERLRERLHDAGLSRDGIERISHAQCALLDEVVLRHITAEHRGHWVAESLQARFLGHHQAGESLYEDMRQALAAPAPDLGVLTVYQRVLHLGFQGRYPALDDPLRLQLLASLDERVPPLHVRSLLTRPRRDQAPSLRDRLQWLPVQALACAGLLGCVWWALDHWLVGVVTRLVPVAGLPVPG